MAQRLRYVRCWGHPAAATCLCPYHKVAQTARTIVEVKSSWEITSRTKSQPSGSVRSRFDSSNWRCIREAFLASLFSFPSQDCIPDQITCFTISILNALRVLLLRMRSSRYLFVNAVLAMPSYGIQFGSYWR